jgi:hypothetical protein
MTNIDTLTAQLADERDVPLADMGAIVEAYASQISDDTDLYDVETGEISDAGAELIIASVASAAIHNVTTVLDDLMDAQAEASLDRQDERLSRRDNLLRKALAEGTPVREIVELTGLSRERVYQIRDGRR